jgi:hypothetical protein
MDGHSQADGQTDMIYRDRNIDAVNRSQSLESQTNRMAKRIGKTNIVRGHRQTGTVDVDFPPHSAVQTSARAVSKHGSDSGIDGVSSPRHGFHVERYSILFMSRLA